MGLVTSKTLVCDRCGAHTPVSENSSVFDVAESLDGWVRVGADRFLCPSCAPGYDLLVARHKVELDDYASGR